MFSKRSLAVGAAVSVLASTAAAQSASDNVNTGDGDGTLPAILVFFGIGLSESGLFGGGDETATGVTHLNQSELNNRSDGTGDANAVLKTLPNVQWRNQATDDGGTSLSREMDLSPLEVSISGGNVYDNNFLLDGIEINRVAGSEGDADKVLEDDDQRPNVDGVYGGHSQSIFISPQLLESMTVHDSNVSAEYGHFQGGVVEYKTRDPYTDRLHAGFTSLLTTSDMANFHIATEDGENPKDRTPPDYVKDQEAVWVSGPLNDRWAVLLSAGREHAWGEKDREYQFVDQSRVETETLKETYMAKLKGQTEVGVFTLQSIYAPYSESWDSSSVWNGGNVIVGDGLLNSLKLEKDLGNFGLFKGVALETIAHFNTTHSGRDGETNVAYNAYKQDRYGYISPNFDMCRVDPNETRTFCRVGTYGDLYEDQNDLGLKFKTAAKLFDNDFKFGGGVTRIDATRERPEDVFLYGTVATVSTAGSFTCDDPNDPLCYDDDQYANRRTTYSAYKTDAAVTNLDLYGEYDFDLGRVDMRLGVRADYEDYQKNLNLSPRLSASVEALGGVTVTGGYGRYYTNSMLAYAIRDGLPKGYTESRSVVDGVVYNTEGGDGWSEYTNYSYSVTSAQGLKTPYTDEVSLGAFIDDPLFGGIIRLKGLHRNGRDQFALESGDYSITGTNVLTNGGTSEYTSASVEYAKYWNGLNFGIVDGFGVTGSLTWADKYVSDNTYFPEDEDNDYIYYSGKSYTRAGFQVVTGNLDIPVRATLGANASLWEGRAALWTNAEISFGYDGVRNTGKTTTVDGFSHDIYEDKTYRPNVIVNVGSRFTVVETKYGKADLMLKVDNVFDYIGDRNADEDYPFKKGRVFWAGLNYTY